MSLPELLAGAVGDEEVVASVPLGGDDVLAVTQTRTLVYRAEGLLSDESVEEYPHGVEQLDVSEGRRKAKITLHYGLDGEETIAVPGKRLDDVLHPILAGVLSASNVTDPGESVLRTFRFSELTLIITSHRVVKHVGSAVWDEDFEEFPYSELTDLDFEEGTVATSVVLAHGGRSERFKAPNDAARAVRETLADAVCEFYEVGSLEEFRLTVQEREESEAEADGEESSSTTDFGDGPDPLSASPVADAENAADSAEPGAEGATASGNSSDGMTVAEAATGETEPADPLTGDPAAEPAEVASGSDAVAPDDVNGASGPDTGEDAFEGSPFESAGVADDEDLAAEVAALRETVEAQGEQLERQSELIETLIEELRRGR
ncbi:hypothetical protein JCM17823_27330 [Halorubrum gandharaense]